ncbi:kinase-like domain-containing protein [Dunaliella salina]|uniref:Kinase-like domain-containing protein n=1 Tax=Dunaliella salina TaxID=3046 RepID=A0ABQ7GVA9_DUNSA|nr:kinase-like domain-containing protein [Dunaliella salina]|eukprot:KAF5838510.1 kinase-like domain-containing protein [Dunaliella salina]
MRCASTETMDQYMPLVGIPNILPMDAPTANKVKEEETESIYYFATLNPNQVSSSKNAMSTANSSNSRSRNTFIQSNKVDPFDDVKLGQLLGTGSYGRVYRGLWNGAVVAVKVLEHLQHDDDPGAPDKEAILNGQLSHPSIVQMYKSCAREIGHSQEEDGKSIMETWMVMEYCNKGSLCDAVDKGWFRSKTSLFEPDWKALIVTAKEIASAMCYLHGCNILHGDLTSNNILLAGGEKDQRMFVSKVADFGLSRVLDLGNDTIQTKTYGTVTYMPPELLMEGKMTKACDVTSLKSLQLATSCPTALKKFIFKCLSVKAEDRPTFAEILPMLDELEDELVGTF